MLQSGINLLNPLLFKTLSLYLWVAEHILTHHEYIQFQKESLPETSFQMVHLPLTQAAKGVHRAPD